MRSGLREQEYLYCFIRESEPQIFKSKGMGDRGDPVTSIHYKDLGVVISTTPDAEYDPSRRHMMTHTKAQEEVMERYSILPVRFNTIAPGKEVIHNLLQEQYDELQELLGTMQGKVEMGLKALWYEGIIFDEILAEYADIRKLRDTLQKQPLQQTYHEQLRLGEMIEQAMQQKRESEVALILDRLQLHVIDTQTDDLVSDRMILNAAFLVEQAKEPTLEQAVEAVDEEMGQRILFRYVGPVPAYNFVNFVLRWQAEA